MTLKNDLRNLWILIPAIPFYLAVLRCLENIPVMDDFDMPLRYCMEFQSAALWDKCTMLFSQYGEHRLLPSKILYLSYYYLTGTFNFRLVGIIGDLQLLVVAFVSVHFLRRYSQYWQFVSFIWLFLIFDLNTYENACMCMNAVGNYGQVAFFFLTLYLYDRERGLALAAVVQVLCAFSNGNGMLAMIIIPFFCWSKGDRNKFMVAAIVSVSCIVLHFIFHHDETLPTKIPFDLGRTITYFIRMAGAHFDFDNSWWIGIIVLAILVYLVGVMLWKIAKKPRELNDAGIICILAFVVGTMLLAAYFRGNASDAQFQTSRYLIYPQLMIACIVALLFNKFRTKLWQRGYMVGLLLIMLPTYKHNYRFGELGFERTQMRATLLRYWHPHPDKAAQICKEACDKGVYCIEDNR
jgi:hypothetical protein